LTANKSLLLLYAQMIAPRFDPYQQWLRLPATSMPVNHYQLLGIPLWTTDADAIVAAAEHRAKRVISLADPEHAPIALRVLAEIALARQCLLTPQSKARYDRRLRGERSESDRWAYITKMPAAPLRQQNKGRLVRPVSIEQPPAVGSGDRSLRTSAWLSRLRLLVAGSISLVTIYGLMARL
jgi:hypothetical protein